jgi:hypothetical protein
MKLGSFDQADWALIRPQLLWFGTAMLLAGVLLLLAQAYVYFSERELAAQRVRVGEISAAAELGVIGKEHRLDWIEALSQLQQTQRDWQLDFSFAPQRSKEGALAEHGVTLYASEMKVRWLAANEWDISRFTAWLAQQTGRAVARDCLFKRSANAGRAGIEVECSYDWLTIAAQAKA